MKRQLAFLICAMFVPVSALAQTGIAGVVRDTTGAVLPGVTVEASSAALIEKARSAITDGQGVYRIIDLRPGVYDVTFNLAGFSTVRREGIELTTNFMATVNANLRVGGLEETVTVSGASPTVDVQNIVQQRVLTADVIAAVPSARNLHALGTLIPGVSVATSNRPSAHDVGGLSGQRQAMTIHGGRPGDYALQIDSMPYTFPTSYTTNIVLNPGESQEFVYEIGAISAEIPTGGIRTNMIPKSGGNLFSGTFYGDFTNGSMQSDNVTDELRARGLPEASEIKKIWDVNPSVGGPIKRDKLWFFSSFRYQGLEEYIAGVYGNANKFPNDFVYTPDRTQRFLDDSWSTSESLRLTWQTTPKNKVAVYGLTQQQCQCHWGAINNRLVQFQGTSAPEAAQLYRYPVLWVGQVAWSSPVSSRLLAEAGMGLVRFVASPTRQPGPAADAKAFSANDLGLAVMYRTTWVDELHDRRARSYRAALNYVTGSHAFKTGFLMQEGTVYNRTDVNGDMTLQFLNGVPRQVTVYATPYADYTKMNANLGFFAQDQWTIKRLTLNLGLRFDYLNASVPAQQLAAVQFVPARSYAEVPDVPNWTDVSPRFGAAYDLFGDGKTAVKVSLSRYLDNGVAVLSGSNPVNTSVNQTTRTWTDRNGDYVPQEEELGPLANPAFGQRQIRTRYDDDVREGFGKRVYNWETSASIQHELLPRVSVNAGYFRRWYGNFTVTDNLLNTPADYDPYCITAPVDARLPGGGGNQICGLFDVKPNKRATNNLVTFAKNFGDYSEYYDGVDLTTSARLPRGAFLAGGVSVGRKVLDICDVQGKVDQGRTVPRYDSGGNEGWLTLASPSTRFCHQARPWQPNVKFLGTVELPWGIQTAATFQSATGPEISATYVATNSEIAPSLGRDLSTGARGTALVDLIEPGTRFEKRLYQVDLRVAKVVGVGRTRIKGMLDLYNLFNASPVLKYTATYGPNWLKPDYVLPGRTIKVGTQVDF